MNIWPNFSVCATRFSCPVTLGIGDVALTIAITGLDMKKLQITSTNLSDQNIGPSHKVSTLG